MSEDYFIDSCQPYDEHDDESYECLNCGSNDPNHSWDHCLAACGD